MHTSKPLGPLKNKVKARSFERLTHLPLFTDISSNSPVNTHHIHHNNDLLLLESVQQLHPSNLKCCDCNSTKTVDWISINLLCVLCIKCSGIHRSMGSHISKVRSLTLDTFKTPEMIHLIKFFVRNDIINSIYEANLGETKKITSNATDLQRMDYINNKYKCRKFVENSNLSYDISLKSLIQAIHIESISQLQKTIAQSSTSLKLISQHYNNDNKNTKNISLFKYSLNHNLKKNASLVFHITEFLLINGLLIDSNFPSDEETLKKWPEQALTYWQAKLEMYGDTILSIDSSSSSSSSTPSFLESNDKVFPLDESFPNTQPKKKSSSLIRWSLNSIPKTSQNIITMHKSLKRNTRKGSNPST